MKIKTLIGGDHEEKKGGANSASSSSLVGSAGLWSLFGSGEAAHAARTAGHVGGKTIISWCTPGSTKQSSLRPTSNLTYDIPSSFPAGNLFQGRSSSSSHRPSLRRNNRARQRFVAS